MKRESKELQIYENENFFIKKKYIRCKTIIKEEDSYSTNNENINKNSYRMYVCGQNAIIEDLKNYEEINNHNNSILKENYIFLKNSSNLNYTNEVSGERFNNMMNNNEDNNENYGNNYNFSNTNTNPNENELNGDYNNYTNKNRGNNNDKIIYLDDSEDEENNSQDNQKDNNMQYSNINKYNNINNFNNMNNTYIYDQNMNNTNMYSNSNINIPLSQSSNIDNINNNSVNNGQISEEINQRNINKYSEFLNHINKNNENENNQNNSQLFSNGPTFKCDKQLYYRRRISSKQKFRYKGKDKLNVQFYFGNYDKNSDLPAFIFTREKFHYFPHNLRQLVSNTAYIISFPGLHRLFQQRIIKKDLVHVCTYYFRHKRGKQTSVDIKIKDEKTLNDGVFLNDGIINFYLKIIEDEYAYNQVDGKISDNNVLIMKSYFYNSLSNQQNQDLSNNFTYPDSCSFIGTKINVFNFKTLIIPICESYHWSLIIVNDIDKMKNLFNNMNEDDEFVINNFAYNSCESGNNLDNDSLDYPEIFYLDSFFDMNQRRMVIILKYLFYEYQKIYNPKCDMTEFFLKNFQKIQCYIPDVPKQDNSFDCGIFLIMYAELFLFNPNYFLRNSSKKYKALYYNEKNKYKNEKNEMNNNISNNENTNSNGNENNAINNNIMNNENIVNYNIMNYNNNYNMGKNNNVMENNSNINNDKNINEYMNGYNYNQNNVYHNCQNYADPTNSINNQKEKDNNSFINDPQNNINNNDNFQMNGMGNQDYEKNNTEQMDQQQSEYNNMYGNGGGLRDEQINENSLKNWFSSELISNKRIKIKNLISELSKIEKDYKNINIEEIIKIQNNIIKKYMDEQKKEFSDNFSKLEI